ncbi:MAG: hypothetical protein JSS86_05850 [Cyanobacteria bacterium SZAS LIN-2]|nr:hypothetical protein [Cyanobacteria bacterium SZAS LIN-2]
MKVKILSLLGATLLLGAQVLTPALSAPEKAKAANSDRIQADESAFLPEDRAYVAELQKVFNQLGEKRETVEANDSHTISRINYAIHDLRIKLRAHQASVEHEVSALNKAIDQYLTQKGKSKDEPGDPLGRASADQINKLAAAAGDNEVADALLRAAYRLKLKSGAFDQSSLDYLEQLSDVLCREGKARMMTALWKQASEYLDREGKSAVAVDGNVFFAALERASQKFAQSEKARASSGLPTRGIDRIEAEERLKELESAPANPENAAALAQARLKMARWYQADSNHGKMRQLLREALTYLESADGKVESDTTKDLLTINSELVLSEDKADQELVMRCYSLIEEKAEGGCSEAGVFQLTHNKLPAHSVQAAQLLKVLSRVIAIREKREGENSVHLEPLLTNFVMESQRQGLFDQAIAAQARILGLLQLAHGVGSDQEVIETAELAWLCIKAEKYDDARVRIDQTIKLVQRRQSSPALTASIGDQLGAMSSAYTEKGKLSEADSILRQGIELCDRTTAPGARHVALASAVDSLVEKYCASSQQDSAIALLQFVVDTRNFGAESINTNHWRYQLAQLYLDKSNSDSSQAAALQAKSRALFDQAQEVSRKNTALTTPRVTGFIKARREALKKYGMAQEAAELSEN